MQYTTDVDVRIYRTQPFLVPEFMSYSLRVDQDLSRALEVAALSDARREVPADSNLQVTFSISLHFYISILVQCVLFHVECCIRLTALIFLHPTL